MKSSVAALDQSTCAIVNRAHNHSGKLLKIRFRRIEAGFGALH
jgi:hypothetical protein